MFKVKNMSTGKLVKNAITGKAWVYDTLEQAQKCADEMHRDSVLFQTFSRRPSMYKVISAGQPRVTDCA